MVNRKFDGKVLVLVVASLLWATDARAQDTPPPATPAPATASAAADGAAGAGAVAAQQAQINGMIGAGEFMLILDKPFEAEKLFNAVLQMDPGNAYAQQALERVRLAKRPNWTFLIHPFKFNLDMWLLTYGGGPSFYTKNLKATFWVGDGFYKNNIDPNNTENPLGFLGYQIGTADDKALRKQTYNATFEPYYKQLDGYFYLNRTVYQEAPDRTLWTAQVTWNRQPGRESYTVFGGQHDSYFQGQLSQYFAPESWSAVQMKILSREIGASATIPIGNLDIAPSVQRITYTDDNARRLVRVQVMYRLLPSTGQQMPVFRVGIHYTYDDTDRPSLFYYAPLKYHQYAFAADYTFISGKTRYGVYGFIPFTGVSGDPPVLIRPPFTAFAFINRMISPTTEVWFKFAGLYTTHHGPRFGDYVFGINTRF